MIAYQTKFLKLAGTSYKEVYKKAQEVFGSIKRRTKRKPYLRSAYFHKEKIFFDNFWVHLTQKRRPERLRRLKFFLAAIELIRKSRNHPDTIQNPSKESELLHRFQGLTKKKEVFYVQIKEHKRTGRKQLMSIFPKR
ncbi:hypothetical protein ACFLZP_00980 [Patescibacteria group bacterium]